VCGAARREPAQRPGSGYDRPVSFQRLVAVAAVVAIAGCGAAARPGPRVRLSPKEIAERSKPAIVRVETGDDRIGTGFALDAGGLIATNLHVIAGAREIKVRLLDGSVFDVQSVAAVDGDRDLALITIAPSKKLTVLALGDSDKVAAGDPVVAIGNPLGVLDYSVSDGLISSVRVLTDDLTVLQTSAPISQGSSGGPLFNTYGEVIGVATAIFAGGQNLNFAVPANYLKPMVKGRGAMALDEFAARTRPDEAPAEGEAKTPRIQRKVPFHEVATLDGCAKDDLADVVSAISSAIELGAPLYNQGNHEACYRIYEGTAMKFEREGTCKGVREAFGNGLLRAATLDSFTEKAWALRDTFDGLLDVMVRKAKAAP
jgi:serine protease Do